MKQLFIIMLMLSISISFAQNTGIGTITPTEKLDVAGGNVRIRDINTTPGVAGTDKTVVVDANGVLKTLAATSISAVRATGSVNHTTSGQLYDSNAPTETFDNLGEFSGNTFTASKTGFYQVSFKTTFPQRTSATDNGDGYSGGAFIDLDGVTYSTSSTKVNIIEATSLNGNISGFYSELVKLNAGQKVSFRTYVFGTTVATSVSFIINISRVD